MPRVGPLPLKEAPSFCLLRVIFGEHSLPHLPVLCPENSLRSSPTRFFFLIPSASLGLYNVQESCKPLVNSHGSMFIPRTRVDTTNTPAYNLLNIGGEAMAKEEGMK